MPTVVNVYVFSFACGSGGPGSAALYLEFHAVLLLVAAGAGVCGISLFGNSLQVELRRSDLHPVEVLVEDIINLCFIVAPSLLIDYFRVGPHSFADWLLIGRLK